jgi:hypothetical protein
MSLHAVEAIDDAVDATRAFLWPFDRGRWGRLALIVFFVGGAGGFPGFQFSGGSPGGTSPEAPSVSNPADAVSSIGGPELAVIAAVFGVVLLLVLGFAFVGSVMEFVLFESLRQESVTIREYWRRRWRQGVRLFGFRILLGVLTLGTFGTLAVAVLTPVVFGDGGLSIALLVVALPVFLVVLLVSSLVDGFTTVFVVPVMIVEDRRLLSAWRRFWPTLTEHWKQYAAYVVLRFVLGIVAGILTGIGTVLGAIAIGIPLGIVAAVGVGLLGVAEIIGWAVIALVAALFVLGLLVIGLLVAVPVKTYFRYYALFVLGDTNDRFDLIADRRRTVRSE